MATIADLFRSTVGKKVVMAATGLLLVGFVVAHMVGNLKIFFGPDKYNAYARFLREMGDPLLGYNQALWLMRTGLLLAVILHTASATQLYLVSRRARDVGYKRGNDLSFSYASRTMRWGGLILVGFVLYHLLHLTLGTVHPDFSHESVYHNVVRGFQSWPVSVAYMLCMLPLGLHLYHGLWSITQTLGIDLPWVCAIRRSVAAVVALAVVLGNLSMPLAVMAGLIR